MSTKTIILQVEPSEQDTELLTQMSIESARWMNKVFHKLYADKRNGKWEQFGVDKEWSGNKGGTYGTLIKWQENKECWKVNDRVMYPIFVCKDSSYYVYAQPSLVSVGSMQSLGTKVATVWSNFLNRQVKMKGLPHFKPTVMFQVGKDKFEIKDGKIKSIKLNKNIRLKVKDSDDPTYIERLKRLVFFITKCISWSQVEIKQKDDGKWYAYIPVAVEFPRWKYSPDKVMGVDLGIANLMTSAVIENMKDLPTNVVMIPGGNTFQKLERIQARVRGLRSKKDKGNSNTQKVLERLKGKKTQVQRSIIRQSATKLVKLAKENGVEGLAIENLRSMKVYSGKGSGKRNRLLTNWAKGESASFLQWKANEYGLRLLMIDPANTSRKCPVCGYISNRNRLTQSNFTCVKCGYHNHADIVGAINIAREGLHDRNPKYWGVSQSTSPVGETGTDSNVGRRVDSTSNSVGESLNPLTVKAEQIDGGLPSNVTTETSLNPTNGCYKADNIGSSRRNLSGEIRSETCSSQKIFPDGGRQNIYKEGESSTYVTTPCPEGSRTDSGIEEKRERPENLMSKTGGSRK